jgi:hypothetical protein
MSSAFPVLLGSTKNRQAAWPASHVLQAEQQWLLEHSARLTVSPIEASMNEKPAMQWPPESCQPRCCGHVGIDVSILGDCPEYGRRFSCVTRSHPFPASSTTSPKLRQPNMTLDIAMCVSQTRARNQIAHYWEPLGTQHNNQSIHLL